MLGELDRDEPSPVRRARAKPPLCFGYRICAAETRRDQVFHGALVVELELGVDLALGPGMIVA
jgi:hypothetical protein